MAGSAQLIPVGQHRLAATVHGAGSPAVVIEPSFGGGAADWTAVAERLSGLTTVVTYDRAPYGASSAARDARTPRDIAADLDGLLRGLQVTGPLVVVGHSAGGLYARAFADRRPDRVAGLVLVESSHEGQGPALDPLRSWRSRLGNALVIPSVIRESRRSRRGGDRRSVIREWRSFRRATAGQPVLPAGGLGSRPLVVLTCAPGEPDVPFRVWRAWHDLHAELAGQSANSLHLVSASIAHYLHQDDPDLVVSAITDVVGCVRSGGRLDDLARPGAAVRGARSEADRAPCGQLEQRQAG
jgi:pimeloyl-ACP methyl ester carboxylesterase